MPVTTLDDGVLPRFSSLDIARPVGTVGYFDGTLYVSQNATTPTYAPLAHTAYVPQLGWGSYQDTARTSGSPQVFADGVRQILTNNAGVTLNDYLPTPQELWADNKITPTGVGEAYDLRVDFTYQPSAGNRSIELILDIGSDPLGVDSIPIVRRTITAARGTVVQYGSVGFTIYCLSAFNTNGGTILLEAIGANFNVYDCVITLVRNH